MGNYAYFQGGFVPLAEAKINVMTHAFNYGTGCFEGIRGYWNEDEKQLYVFRMREHYERLERSARILGFCQLVTVDEACGLDPRPACGGTRRGPTSTFDPSIYKSSEVVGVECTTSTTT